MINTDGLSRQLPTQPLFINQSQHELEEFLLFCINVAGVKTYLWKIQADKLHSFLRRAKNKTQQKSPFNCIKKLIELGDLEQSIRYARIASGENINSTARLNSYVDVCKLGDLQSITLDNLLKVRGIGLKTAQLFLSHSREDFNESNFNGSNYNNHNIIHSCHNTTNTRNAKSMVVK